MTSYTTIKLPKCIVEQIDEVVANQNWGYSSRAEFVKDAIRRYLMKAEGGEIDGP